MELNLYTALKAHIQSELPAIKHIAIWNNQFQSLMSERSKETPFLFPCVFLEFNSYEFKDLAAGVQEFDMTVVTHLGFESYKTDDTTILTTKQQLYSVVQRFQNGYFARLTRIGETPDYDHSNIQAYTTSYKTRGKDYTTDIRNTKTVQATIVLSGVSIVSGVTSTY